MMYDCHLDLLILFHHELNYIKLLLVCKCNTWRWHSHVRMVWNSRWRILLCETNTSSTINTNSTL